jgi:hypothetical protein
MRASLQKSSTTHSRRKPVRKLLLILGADALVAAPACGHDDTAPYGSMTGESELSPIGEPIAVFGGQDRHEHDVERRTAHGLRARNRGTRVIRTRLIEIRHVDANGALIDLYEYQHTSRV